MIAARVVMLTREMWPVVIVVVMSVWAGISISPQMNLYPVLDSGGVKVTRWTVGQSVQSTEMTKKLHIPITARKRRVARVNIAVSLSGSPKRFFCSSAFAFDTASSLASSLFSAAAFFSAILATTPPAILRRDPIPVAPSVDTNIVISPNITFL